VTVTAPTTAELCRRRDEAAARADIVELRLDSVSDPDVAGALAGRRGRVIVTCRPQWEGGRFSGPEDVRRRLLADAIALGADFVDVEWQARFDDLIEGRKGRGIVISSHDFAGVPKDLGERVRAMKATGAEVVKIAVKTERLADCLPLLDLGARAGTEGGLVAVGMGDAGLVTRVLPGRFGSLWTYAGSERHVGQLTATMLLKDYRFRALTDTTGLYGVVGLPLSHSVSPAMHNAAFAAANLDAIYLPLPAASPDDFVTFGRAIGIKGASITIPYKVSLAERVDEVDEVSRRVGAINTMQAVEGRWSGRNTDVAGFLAPLQGRVSLPGMRAAVLGAGGAARAVAVALGSSGCRVRIHARNLERAEEVARLTSAECGPYPPEPGSWDLLVNCTPIGTYPHVDETPIDAGMLTGRMVYDLVYNPAETRLLREARRAGCETIGGLDMLVGQAREQFHWWTGIRPSAAVMRDAARERLAEVARHEDHLV
jgi:3-dehydroquinate dehydratase/shikimate dehydrogenase